MLKLKKTFENGYKLYIILAYLIDISLCYIYNFVFFYFVVKKNFTKGILSDYKFWIFILGPFFFNLLISFPMVIKNGARPGLAILRIKMKFKNNWHLFFANFMYSAYMATAFSILFFYNDIFAGTIFLSLFWLNFIFNNFVLWDVFFNIQYKISQKH